MSKQNMPSDELVKIAVAALEEIKATDITVIDVKDKTSITDFMVIASGCAPPISPKPAVRTNFPLRLPQPCCLAKAPNVS